MKDQIHLQIATADGTAFDGQCSYVEIPLEGGSVGVLSHHAPMLGAIKDGVVTARQEDGTQVYIAVGLGVANISNNEMILLVRTAECAENIDLARAEASEQRARERLADKESGWDMMRAEAALYRSIARQNAARMMSGMNN